MRKVGRPVLTIPACQECPRILSTNSSPVYTVLVRHYFTIAYLVERGDEAINQCSMVHLRCECTVSASLFLWIFPP